MLAFHKHRHKILKDSASCESDSWAKEILKQKFQVIWIHKWVICEFSGGYIDPILSNGWIQKQILTFIFNKSHTSYVLMYQGPLIYFSPQKSKKLDFPKIPFSKKN